MVHYSANCRACPKQSQRVALFEPEIMNIDTDVFLATMPEIAGARVSVLVSELEQRLDCRGTSTQKSSRPQILYRLNKTTKDATLDCKNERSRTVQLTCSTQTSIVFLLNPEAERTVPPISSRLDRHSAPANHWCALSRFLGKEDTCILWLLDVELLSTSLSAREASRP